MTKSFKLFFAGAVGMALAASFASDAYAIKLPLYQSSHGVGGWGLARTPSFQGPSRSGAVLGYRNMGINSQYHPNRGFAGMMAARNNNLRVQQVQQQQWQYQQQQARQRNQEMQDRFHNQTIGCNVSGSSIGSWVPGQGFC